MFVCRWLYQKEVKKENSFFFLQRFWFCLVASDNVTLEGSLVGTLTWEAFTERESGTMQNLPGAHVATWDFQLSNLGRFTRLKQKYSLPHRWTRATEKLTEVTNSTDPRDVVLRCLSRLTPRQTRCVCPVSSKINAEVWFGTSLWAHVRCLYRREAVTQTKSSARAGEYKMKVFPHLF